MPENGFLYGKKRKFSLLNLRFLPALALQGVGISKMMGGMEVNLLEALCPGKFATIQVFKVKNDRKGNFRPKKREFSLPNVRSLVFPFPEGAVTSKMMGRTRAL